jgi:hypothetical protein
MTAESVYDMPINHYEQEPREVETFGVFDLDRMLLKSDELVDLLCNGFIAYGVPPEDIAKDKSYIHAQKDRDFSATDYLLERYGEEALSGVKEDLLVLAQAGELAGLLYPGARELLETMDELKVPFGILTYGEVPNQQFKLDLVRAIMQRDESSLPAKITDEKSKSHWMHQEWAQPDGRLLVPAEFTRGRAVLANHIVLLDDKQRHLRSPYKKVRGIWIDNEAAKESTVTLLEVVERLHAGYSLIEQSEHYEPKAA